MASSSLLSSRREPRWLFAPSVSGLVTDRFPVSLFVVNLGFSLILAN